MFAPSKAPTPAPMPDTTASNPYVKVDPVINVTNLSQLQDIIAMNPGVVIDFWAPYCPPCVSFKPKFHALAMEYASENVKFVAVNT